MAIDEKNDEKTSGGRWWEFYVVRYALGTVFGVLIVNMLVKSGLAIPFPEGSVSEITKPEGLPLLIGYGLAYCYFASAPILVFHSVRFSMQKTGFRWSTVAILISSAMFAFLWCWFAKTEIHSMVMFVLAALAIAMIVFMTLSQIRALIIGVSKTGEMWIFYRGLDLKRRVKENRELVESYRHLREHGNAFFVVCLEILLGWGIYIAGKVSIFPPGELVSASCQKSNEACDLLLSTGLLQTIVLLLIWIAPAAFVWAIGCLLEREFADDVSIVAELIPSHIVVPSVLENVVAQAGGHSP